MDGAIWGYPSMSEFGFNRNARYLTVVEAAEYMRVSKSTIDKLRTVGGGPKFIKWGRRVLYRIESLDQWMLGLEISSTSETPLNRAA